MTLLISQSTSFVQTFAGVFLNELRRLPYQDAKRLSSLPVVVGYSAKFVQN